MTVQSLWTVLEESNCGTPVGVEEFALKEDAKGRSSVLAVDTSIWICEALSSTALSSFHSDPVLYLIYQRSIKLLKLGLHLIFVIEGDKMRISNNDGQELRKRRSGTEFVAATNRTENLLRMLGVTVVRAEAEGEALCALLNQRGIVDGIISNDADVFLFGGLTVYTRFTLKDLENRTVMKYDADKLRATVAGTGARRSIPLDRKDLIAFALLTGSDMCDNGVKDIGYQKAIKFFVVYRFPVLTSCFHGARKRQRKWYTTWMMTDRARFGVVHSVSIQAQKIYIRSTAALNVEQLQARVVSS